MKRKWVVARQTAFGPVKYKGPYTWLGAQMRRAGPYECVVKWPEWA